MTDLTSTARRRELGAELRRLREQSGYNGNDMATRLSWTASMLSRAETGKRTMSLLEVASYTGLCGVAGKEAAELLGLADEPDNYRLKRHGQLPDALRTLIFHESTADEIQSFQPIYIPGMVQTEDYARALFRETGILDPASIERQVKIRMSRRGALTKWNPPQCTFYLHENVLNNIVGGSQVMYEEMLHMLFVSSRPQCSIRVIPMSAGARGTAAGSFQVFGYPEASRWCAFSTRPPASSLRALGTWPATGSCWTESLVLLLMTPSPGSSSPEWRATTSDRERPSMTAREERQNWRKSSYSGGGGNNDCVEVALGVEAMGVRDSKNTDGPRLAFPTTVWRGFLSSQFGDPK